MIEKGHVEWERFRLLWEAEGRPGYLAVGGITYQVFTPDDSNTPKFMKIGTGQDLYGGTSMQAPFKG
jgi:hypothetical protein